jgi:hypothetical protein
MYSNKTFNSTINRSFLGDQDETQSIHRKFFALILSLDQSVKFFLTKRQAPKFPVALFLRSKSGHRLTLAENGILPEINKFSARAQFLIPFDSAAINSNQDHGSIRVSLRISHRATLSSSSVGYINSGIFCSTNQFSEIFSSTSHNDNSGFKLACHPDGVVVGVPTGTEPHRARILRGIALKRPRFLCHHPSHAKAKPYGWPSSTLSFRARQLVLSCNFPI